MTLYETLGVARDASAEEIKAAFRRASSKAHPDREGCSASLQALVNEAYAVLSDPARRKEYDATGNTVQTSIEQEALGLFAKLLEKALDTIESAELDGLVVFLQRAAEKVRSEIKLRGDSARELEKRIERKLRKLKHKGEGRNVLADMLTHKASEMRAAIEAANHGLKVSSLVVKMAAEYDPDAPAPTEEDRASVLISAMLGRTSAFDAGGFRRWAP